MGDGTIFFSYSRKDSEFVLDLARELRSSGANIWLDQLDIEPGTAWDDSIEEALARSSTLLVILSKTSVASQNVRDEYSYALEEGKRVVPVLMEACTIPFRLRRLQYADFTQEREVGLKTLAETLQLQEKAQSKRGKTIVPETPTTKPKAETPKPRATSSLKDRPYLIFGGLIALAVLYWVVSSLLPDKGTGQVTVMVHSEKGKDQLVLPGRGEVTLVFGDASVVETINAKGEATFKQIPESFFDSEAVVEVLFADPQGEPYRSMFADSLFHLKADSYIALPVKLYGLDAVRGIVKDFNTGQPMEGVRVSISGVEAFSNSYGEYELEIPAEKQQKFQTVRAFKDGYALFEQQQVPIQTDTELPIMLKPIE